MSAIADKGVGGRILLVDDRPSSCDHWLRQSFPAEHTIDVEINPAEALFHAAEGTDDSLIVSLSLENYDGLRLCSQARSLERTRQLPILAISERRQQCAAAARARNRRQPSTASGSQERIAARGTRVTRGLPSVVPTYRLPRPTASPPA